MNNDNKGVHLRHCFQGEHATNCKYGEDETCPARPINKVRGKAEWEFTGQIDCDHCKFYPKCKNETDNCPWLDGWDSGQLKMLRHLYDYVSTWSHGVCIDDECDCPYSHIRQIINKIKKEE